MSTARRYVFERGARASKFNSKRDAQQRRRDCWICRQCFRRYDFGKAKKSSPVCDGAVVQGAPARGGCGSSEFEHFPSSGEATYYLRLANFESLGAISGLQLHTRHPLLAPGPDGVDVVIGMFEIDFVYQRDGATVREDYKGSADPKDQDPLWLWKLRHYERQTGYTVTIVTN